MGGAHQKIRASILSSICDKIYATSGWRNWQTRSVQNAVPPQADWEFESPPGHSILASNFDKMAKRGCGETVYTLP